MRTIITKASIAALALVGLTGAVQAQAAVHLVAQQDSKLWVEGGSNLHAWSCKAGGVDATIDADATIARPGTPLVSKLVQGVQITISVGAIKCGEDRMDKNLYKALKSDVAPTIRYRLTTIEAAGASDSVGAKAVGKLTIAGVEKDITMSIVATRLANGSLKATGSVPLLMTDFGIKPPTAILGTLRTKNEVTVKFELIVAQRIVNAASGER